jgi:hypothetical protein
MAFYAAAAVLEAMQSASFACALSNAQWPHLEPMLPKPTHCTAVNSIRFPYA